MKRKLIIHCSDSPYDHHGVEAITDWHIERGFDTIGYHWVIEISGELKQGRKYYPGAHCKGRNYETGLCLCGLSGKFENEQMQTLEQYIIDNRNNISEIKQHSDFEPKKPHCAGLTESQINYLNSLL